MSDMAIAPRGRRAVAWLRCAAVTVVVAGICAAATAHALTPTPTPTGPRPPTPSGVFRLLGHVASAADCQGDRADIGVSIEPSSRSTVTSSTGEFMFTDLPAGEYYLQFEPNCPLIPCYPPLFVTIAGLGDAMVDVCYDGCPGQLLLWPGAGVPGSVFDVMGRCDAVGSGDRVQILFDDQPMTEATADDAGLYHATLSVPLGAQQNALHTVRALLDGAEIAQGVSVVRVGAGPCVGDCDRNFVVTVDELVRGVSIALGALDPSVCVAMETTGNGTVTVEELVAAIGRALEGCHAPDLVPVSARFSRCVAPNCAPLGQPSHFMQVCVDNRGDADAGFFSVAQLGDTQPAASVAEIAAGGQACVELPFTPAVSVYADADDIVAERDETNNRLDVALPFPTACDFIDPSCTPRPRPITPTPSR